MKPRLLSLLFLLALTVVVPLQAADAPKLFTEGVRAADPLTPEQQQKTFHLPAGFKIQLVAAEPDLRKPMNMAFDSAGRLWVTESREYPFAATNAALARDTIRIFSDFDDNGRARKVTTFATNLNIPIGIYPFRAPRGSGQPTAVSGQQSAVSSQPKTGTPPPSTPHSPSPIPHSLTWKCLAWSIPHIWLFEDTDGDGVADRQEKLYGPFDHTRDTHGNQASFRRGLDGWIYATHGFNNQSRVSGTDGHEIFLPSGNVYRLRLDGSRLEHWTHGQVNPFGLTFDPLGNLYSADCHSSPIYQLLRGAHYPSFGRPHDGLGFAPTTIQHTHHSTAICGIVHISDPAWPAEYQGNLFVGNVMTSRINRDQIEWRGSTSVGKELPDFLSTDDPWFRPVDLQIGPDGALWVADFYNRIIGHYEVPLLHPARDRERGRIWRIIPPSVAADVRRRTDNDATKESASLTRRLPDLTRLDRDALLHELLGQNPTRVALAREELALLPDPDLPARLLGAARGQWHFRQADDREGLMTSTLWLLHRAGQLDEKTLLAALTDRDEPIRVHAARILTDRGLHAAAQRDNPARPASLPLPAGEGRGEGERSPTPNRASTTALSPIPHSPSPHLPALRTALADPSAHVARAAADALAANPHPDNLPPLLALQKRVPAEDTHLTHVLRLALREQLRLPGAFAQLTDANLPPADARAFATVALALTNAEAATYLIRHLAQPTEPTETIARYITHAARYAPDADLPKLAALGRRQFATDLDTQAALFKAMLDGQAARRAGGFQPPSTAPSSTGTLPPDLRAWGTDLATQLLTPTAQPATWTHLPLNPAAPARNPFALEDRTSADGQKTRLMSSFPHGETLTGILRSPVFVLPKELTFYLCGHDGPPGQPAAGKNHVRLRLVKDTDKAEAIEIAPSLGARTPTSAASEAGRARIADVGVRAPLASAHPQPDSTPRRPASLPLHEPPADSGRPADGFPSVGFPESAGDASGFMVPIPGFRTVEATHEAASRARVKNPRDQALGGSRDIIPRSGSSAAIAEHQAADSLPAGPSRGEVESSPEPAGIAVSQARAAGGQDDCTPRQDESSPRRVDAAAGRVGPASSPRLGAAQTRLDDTQARLDDAQTRLDDAQARLDDAQTRLDDAQTRLDDAQTRPDAEPTRLDLAKTRTDLTPTRLEVAQTRRDAAPTRLAELPAPNSQLQTRLAAAPAVGDLPQGVIRQAKVPRNDIAQKITWDLAEFAGQRAVIEVTDGDDGKAYAWLALGRFAPALPELTLGEVQSPARRQQAGADLARSLHLDYQPHIVAAVAKTFAETPDDATRAAAGRAWLALDPPNATDPLARVLGGATQPENLRAELAIQFAQLGINHVVVAALTNAPSRLQTRFAAALVSTAAGAEQLLTAAESGRIPARLLQDRALTDRLRASPARDAKDRHAVLVKNLPAADAQLQKFIEAKRAEFKPAQANASRGAEVFTKACVTCHQLDGQGALVGPQLDGIGGRGLERLLEDILDPNRNVDKAFRTTIYVLQDGETVSGLARREEGGAFIYALANGQEARLPKASVKARRDTETSLMPANFHEALTAAELNDLLAFLLSKSGK